VRRKKGFGEGKIFQDDVCEEMKPQMDADEHRWGIWGGLRKGAIWLTAEDSAQARVRIISAVPAGRMNFELYPGNKLPGYFRVSRRDRDGGWRGLENVILNNYG
jgi:hypothetical protein